MIWYTIKKLEDNYMAFMKTTDNHQPHPISGFASKQVEEKQPPKTITISVPLVITRHKDGDNVSYKGFVPGIIMRDIISSDLDECKAKLMEKAQDKLTVKVQLKSQMPFFPSNEEIKIDFDNVCLIKRIKFSYKEYEPNLL